MIVLMFFAFQFNYSYALSTSDQACGLITEIDNQKITMLTRFETSRNSELTLCSFEASDSTEGNKLLVEEVCVYANIKDAYAKSVIEFRHDVKECEILKEQAEEI